MVAYGVTFDKTWIQIWVPVGADAVYESARQRPGR